MTAFAGHCCTLFDWTVSLILLHHFESCLLSAGGKDLFNRQICRNDAQTVECAEMTADEDEAEGADAVAAFLADECAKGSALKANCRKN